jgi:hypothetical protein
MKTTHLARAALVLALGGGLVVQQGWAADHLDPPGRTDPDSGGTDRTADIADVYAWHTATTLSVVLTYDGPNAPVAEQGLACDRNVLYGIHISNDDDLEPEFDITARYGLDDAGRCFVTFSGAPGVGGEKVTGPTERALKWRDVNAYAGLRDDAFFFDLQGFRETLTTGEIRMTDDRDSFAGLNTSAIVLEFPLSAVSPNGEDFRVWGTTSRIGG